jgi:Flp pilus assembly protein TadG
MTFHPSSSSRDGGTMSLEMVLLTPLFVAFIMLLAWAGRIVDARSQVDSAARDAVRAASTARSESAVKNLAQDAANASLGGVGWCSPGPSVSIDQQSGATNWQAGGQISVIVTCTVNLGDLTFIGLPGTKTITAHATAPIDNYTFRGTSGNTGGNP